MGRRAALLGIGLGLAAPVAGFDAGVARAQARNEAGAAEGSGREVTRIVSDLISSVTEGTRARLFDFFETIEVWDAEAEIDRLVGDPWSLHDSTEYKLRLLPLHLSYPVYARVVDEITRLDDERGLRIQNVSPDEVDRFAVDLGALSADRRPEEFAQVLLSQFSVREFADLAVYGLSHQPFFPDTSDGWGHIKRRLGRHKLALALGVLGIGASFNAGSISGSGDVKSFSEGRYAVGWYGGVRRVGLQFQPQLRAGVVLRSPSLEAALGLWEQVRPGAFDRRRAVELAVREGWLSRLSRPTGWDVFVEGAARRVLAAQPDYPGERTTARVGVYARREAPLGLRAVVFRSSANVESDLRESGRFVVAVGLEHLPSGLAGIVQSTRGDSVVDGVRRRNTQVGLFVAGTLASPTQFALDAMWGKARLVREEHEALIALGDEATGWQAETHLEKMASALADYLESRRLAYSLLHWEPMPTDLHGPLDPTVLLDARRLLLERLHELAGLLRQMAVRARENDRRAAAIQDTLDALDRGGEESELARAYRAELEALDRIRHQEGERVSVALAAFQHDRAALARVAAASRVVAPREIDGVPAPDLRRLAVLAAPRLQPGP